MRPASLLRQISKLALLLVLMAARLASAQGPAAAPSPWDQPAAALAAQIADLLGPGPARLTIRNLSSIPAGEVPTVRRILEQDLQARGIQAPGADAANSIRITLSEDLHERLWVAEIVEGSETRIAMVPVAAGTAREETQAAAVTLREQPLITATSPILAAVEWGASLIAIEQDQIDVFANSVVGWKQQASFPIARRRPSPRDPRAVVVPAADGHGFHAALTGIACIGTLDETAQPPAWTVQCHDSDDPWPIALPTRAAATAPAPLRAFANASRDYFTGVITPGLGVDLPPFYTAALIPRPDGAGLLINGIDAKVMLAESGTLKQVSGARDWGSDFAMLASACGSGAQVIASGSGEALMDSLRAFELPALEAIPSSAPLAMDGTVTALFAAGDSKSVIAIVRKTGGQAQPDFYEVDRVTANCN